MFKVSLTDFVFHVESGHHPRHDRFWRRYDAGNWEPETLRIFDTHIDADTLVVDFGAWIGPTLFYAARKAGLTLGFEPDPVAFKTLDANVKLNADQDWAARVKVFAQGIGSGDPIEIAANGAGGDSMSSALYFDRATSWTVETRRLEDVVAEHRAPFKKLFVKVDVEGGEYTLLPQVKDLMADPANTFLISFHHRRLKQALLHERETPEEAHAALLEALNGVVEALPWTRTITTGTGLELKHENVSRIVSRGKAFAEDILITG